MTAALLSLTPARSAGGRVGHIVLGAAQSVKRTLAGRLGLRYPGQCETGEYFAEIFLTWFFGQGSILWRQRFVSQEAAQRAAKEHAQYLDNVLPTHYRAENWSGRPYWEKHEYGISWGLGQAADRSPDDLVAVSRTTLPGT